MEEQIQQIRAIQADWLKRVINGDIQLTKVDNPNSTRREVEFYIQGNALASTTLYQESKTSGLIFVKDLTTISPTYEECEKVYESLMDYVRCYDEEYLDQHIAELQEQRLKNHKEKLAKIIEGQLREEFDSRGYAYVSIEPSDVSHGMKTAEGVVESIYSKIPEYADHVTGVKLNDYGRYNLTFDSQEWQDKYNYALAEFCQKKQAWCDKYGCD